LPLENPLSPQENSTNGYICVPYLHDHDSIELKDTWFHSQDISDVYFVTATFSNESKLYFPTCANHYLLAKFNDCEKIKKEIEKYNKEKTSFVFNMDDGFFERNADDSTNFISVYYLDYGETLDDFIEVANVIANREKVKCAGLGHMEVFPESTPQFTFPYRDNIVILEVSSDKSFQSVNQYCEKTRRQINRKGIVMTNLISFSILEKLK